MEISSEKLEELSQFYSDAKIAKQYGVSAETIRKRRIKFGIKPKKRRAFDPDKEVLESLYQKMSMRDIARKFGVGETIVWKRLKEHGIKLHGYENGGHRLKPGRTFSEEHLANLRAAAKKNRGKFAGESSPHWKGGISGSSGADRRNGAYREWKRSVFENASYKCKECGVRHGDICNCCGAKTILHAHHVQSYKDHPELRHDPSNGIALCSKCHHKRHF